MTDKEIAENLKKFRNDAGLTQDQMSEKIGVCRATYISMEKGKTPLINGKLYKAAEVLDCDAEKLVSGYSQQKWESLALKDAEAEKEELIKENRVLKEENEKLKDDIILLKQLNAYMKAELDKFKG